MRIDHIVHLDDLLRTDSLRARGFIYASIAEPLRQAFASVVPDPSRFPLDRGLSPGFELSRFSRMCPSTWQTAYRGIPEPAVDYLLEHLPPNALVIGYEMPPWLRNALDAAKVPRVDLRVSPLRFARDLVMAVEVRTPADPGLSALSSRLAAQIRIDAGLMQAAVQHNGPVGPTPEGLAHVVFIGQTESDASLIDDSGDLVRIERYADRLRTFVGQRSISYACHPYAGAYGSNERRRIGRILGRTVGREKKPLYDLMAGRQRIDFISISSGALQEASHFGQRGETLFRPICPMETDAQGRYQFASFSDVTSPEYWLAVVGTGSYTGVAHPMPENLMRRLHNAWWGYADFYIDNDAFWRRVISRSLWNMIKRMRG
ncbi:hypothetical protein [Luteibacter jiangsuensis]